MPRGTCETCGRTYRLPENRRAGRCPRCAVSLRMEANEAPEEATRSECPHCGHETWSTDASCPGCGARLEDTTLALPSADGGEIVFGSHQWRQAYRLFTFVRLTFFWSGLVLLILLVVFALAWSEVGAPLTPVVIGTAILLGLVVLGLFRVERQPFGWSLFMAIAVTAYAGLLLGVLGLADVLVTRDLIILGVISATLWSAVAVAARVRPLLRTHPDLFVVRIPKRRKGVRRAAGPGEIRGKLLEQALRTRRRTRRILAYITLVVGALVTWAIVVDRMNAPADHETVLREFREAWNASDEERLASMTPDDRRARFRRVLAHRKTKYAWGGTLPRIGNAVDIRSTENPYPQVVAWYPLEAPEGARLRIRFGYETGTWTLDAMKVIVP